MLYDYQNCIDFAVEKAVEKAAKENLEKGEKLAKIETAKNLLKENVPLDMIYRVTGLTKKDIENLLHR